MKDIQSVFSRIQQTKKQIKELKRIYQDALDSSLEYQEIKEKLKTLRNRKKQIENITKEQFSSEFTKLEDLKIDLASDLQLLADMAMTKVAKGENLQITDENGVEYEPVFKVSFKKAN